MVWFGGLTFGFAFTSVTSCDGWTVSFHFLQSNLGCRDDEVSSSVLEGLSALCSSVSSSSGAGANVDVTRLPEVG